MKAVFTDDAELKKRVLHELKANDGYCPCQIGRSESTKCMCKDFKENVKVGEVCICGLFIKESN